MTTDYPAILSRKEAQALGLERYFTGKPCRNGHIAERSMRGACLECRSEWFAKHRVVQQAAQRREDRINKRRAALRRAANVKLRLARAQQRSAQIANEAGMASARTRGSLGVIWFDGISQITAD